MNTNPTGIVLRDGFLEVGRAPEALLKKLRYFRREMQLVGYRREVKGRFENLYAERDDGSVVTMPGFAHRVISFFRDSGQPYEFTDARTPMPKPDLDRAFEGLRPYQVKLVGRMLVNGGGVLQAATGAGKTVCAASIFRAFDRDELISRGTPLCVFACPDKDINRKNRDELERFMPGREVGIVMSGDRHPTDDVICCTIDSLERIDAERVGLLVCDEMHTASSGGRQEVLSKFTKAAKWGVSATPTGRFDGGDLVAEGLFGPIVARFSYADGVAAGALVPITVYWVPAPEPRDGLMAYSRLRSRDGKVNAGSLANPAFHQMVADILDHVPDSLQTLCMLQFIEQMSGIHRRCAKGRTGYVHGETDQSKLLRYPTIDAIGQRRRKEIYDDFREKRINSIIATHCWKQGVDFPNLSVVINAGGGGSDIVAKQIPGRASRTADGKDRAYIVDFVHEWDREDPLSGTGKPGPLLLADKARRKAYRDLGFKEVECRSITDLPFLDGSVVECPTARPATPMAFRP